jgi:hypothetical protein
MRLSGHRIFRISLEGWSAPTSSLDSYPSISFWWEPRQGSVAASAQTARQISSFRRFCHSDGSSLRLRRVINLRFQLSLYLRMAKLVVGIAQA